MSLHASALSFGLCLSLGCRDTVAPNISGTDDGASGPFVAVGVGDNTTCALDNQGRVYCWGSNWDGHLGTGDPTYGLTLPHLVQNLPGPATSLAVATNHQCVLTGDGSAYCWGENGGGQLGTGAATAVSGVSPVTGGLKFSSLAAGSGVTCGISLDRHAYCWGVDGSGNLGAGDRQCQGSIPCYVATPLAVAGDLQFVQLTAGRGHTCGVSIDGDGYCWGDNEWGQLGDPTVPIHCGAFPNRLQCIRTSPTRVAGGLKFLRLAGGAFHTCGIVLDGSAYCWGYALINRDIGATAIGNSAYTSPTLAQRGTRVPVPVEGNLKFREITAGNGVTCALTVDGLPVCWGDNNYGQLGRGGIDPDATTSPLVVQMPRAQSAPQIGEDDHACALATSGRIWCWGGLNFFGELGSLPVSEPLVSWILRARPTPVSTPSP